ncbi:MAG: NAD-dependent DNA ligase LigA, partial [Rickettsiales bacterium]|nr:NAD-dependent DNA ligase LigA [Rickettsiales bacterium]
MEKDLFNLFDDEKKLDLQELKELQKKLIKYDDEYYQNDEPVISDSEYDKIKKRAIELEEKYQDFPKIISKKVGAKAKRGFGKIRHQVPMISLDNVFNKEELQGFIDKIKRYLKTENFYEFVGEPKIDGLSFSALYRDGKFVQGATRGDGIEGEDITKNLMQIKDFPLQIKIPYYEIEIRGEVFIDKLDFEQLNKQMQQAGKKLFANPRNAAAGSLRQLDPSVTALRPLKYFVYTWGAISGADFETQSQFYEKMKNAGFNVQDYKKCESFEDLIAYYDYLLQKRSSLSYDIDGVVY